MFLHFLYLIYRLEYNRVLPINRAEFDATKHLFVINILCLLWTRTYTVILLISLGNISRSDTFSN